MRIFLDVGAHVGQTLQAVLDPKYRFDRIVCFEPVPECCEKLRAFRDPRVSVPGFGLWKETCQKPLYDPGSVGGSLYHGLEGADTSMVVQCPFVKASDWFKENISENDVVFVKLNCEGSECDIIDDLLDSGEFRKVTYVMVDFDVRKIPSQTHREEETRRRLRESAFHNYLFCPDVMVGPTHIARTQAWLHTAGADQCSVGTQLRQAWYVLRAPREVRNSILWNFLRRLVHRPGMRTVYPIVRPLCQGLARSLVSNF